MPYIHSVDLSQTGHNNADSNFALEIGKPFSVPYYYSALWAIIDAYLYGRAFGVTPVSEKTKEDWSKTAENCLKSPDSSALFRYLNKIFKGYLHLDGVDPEDYPRLSGPVDRLYAMRRDNADCEKELDSVLKADLNSVVCKMKMEAVLGYLTGLDISDEKGREELINRVFAQIPQSIPEGLSFVVSNAVSDELQLALGSFFRTEELKLKDFGDDLFLQPESRNHLKTLEERLTRAAEQLSLNREAKVFYNREDWLEYLKAYYAICSFLLDPKNGILIQDELHNAKALEMLLKLGLISDERNPDIYYSSIYSPMTMWAFFRFFDHLKLYAEQCPHGIQTEDQLFVYEIQKASILSQFERTLRRRIVMRRKNGSKAETFLVHPHRFFSALQCVSYDSLSSIESVRIIRLFEKIAAGIRRILSDETAEEAQRTFVVSIFDFVERGLCEQDDNGRLNKDINLLVNELIHWYSQMLGMGKLQKGLTIELRFYTNQSWLDPDNNCHKPLSLDYEVQLAEQGEKLGAVKVITDTSTKGTWKDNSNGMPSAELLTSAIGESQSVFFIACPWLSTEDFELRNSGSLETFSRRLEFITLEQDLKNNELALDITAESILQQMEAQFGRIMNGEDNKFGYTTRVPKDYLLQWFRETLDESKNRKELFVYYPISDGMNRSLYNMWPASRPEMYSNKDFRILRFSSFASMSIYDSLTPRSDRPLRIRFWSLLKATNIMIAYIQLAADVHQQFADAGLVFPPEELVTLYRNIILNLEFSADTPYSVTVKICKTPELEESMLKRSFSATELKSAGEALDRFLRYVVNVVESTLTSFIFNDAQSFGGEDFQNAFETVVYSSASCVEHILFLHLYRKARKDGNLHRVSVKMVREIETVEKVGNYGNDAFSDKFTILSLLEAFDNNRAQLTMVDGCLRQVAPKYQSLADARAAFLPRIQEACRNAGYTDNRLYANLTESLSVS